MNISIVSLKRIISYSSQSHSQEKGWKFMLRLITNEIGRKSLICMPNSWKRGWELGDAVELHAYLIYSYTDMYIFGIWE